MPAQQITTITINAPPEQVWAVLVDFDAWHSWNTFITSIHSHSSSPGVGTKLTFTSHLNKPDKPGTYNVRLSKWDASRREFEWKGGPLPEMLGWILQGRHWFKCASVMEDGKEEKTLFEHGEEVEGMAGVLVPGSMLVDLKIMLDRFNGELKKRVEGGGRVGQA